MKVFWLIFSIQVIISFDTNCQEERKSKMPLFVSHLSAENAAVTRRKEAPKHFFLTRVICFRKKCRAFIGWRTQQRSMRYDYTKTSKFRKSKAPASTDSITVLQDKPIKKMPAKETVKPPLPILKTDSIIVLSDVLFETNSYKLNKELMSKLDSISAFVRKQSQAELIISGHTDNVGKESYNLNLSSQRAESVAEYFLDKGIAPEQVTFFGYGSAQPIATNATPEGRKKNRRVEIRIHGKN
jgi:outer membrane protein OmpA-like peptidoglycan-associated protein